VKNPRDLFNVMETKAVGDKVAVTVLRTDIISTYEDGLDVVQEAQRYRKMFTVTLIEKMDPPSVSTGVQRTAISEAAGNGI